MVEGKRMHMRPFAVVVAAAAVLMIAGRADAGGFQINEHSAAAMGRANSVVATTNEPSSIFHNPAGLTQTEGTQFEAGLTLIKPTGSYRGVGVPSANATGAPVDQSTDVGFLP